VPVPELSGSSHRLPGTAYTVRASLYKSSLPAAAALTSSITAFLPRQISWKGRILSNLTGKGKNDKPDKLYRTWVRMCACVIGDRKEKA
jgi:predicted alpha/beta hydrolase